MTKAAKAIDWVNDQTSVELRAVGEAVRKLRKMRGLTQGQLGERSGLSLTGIHRIETGKCSSRFHFVSQVAQGLGINLFDLVVYASHLSSEEDRRGDQAFDAARRKTERPPFP